MTHIDIQNKGAQKGPLVTCNPAAPPQEPAYDSGSYAKIVTRDASEEGGSAPACSANVRKARLLPYNSSSPRRLPRRPS